MLESYSRSVLRAVLKIYKSDSKHNRYVGPSSRVMAAMRRKTTLDMVDDALWFLESKGLVKCVPADCTICAVELTFEGIRYYNFQFVELKSFFIRSILTPIITALATTLITLWLAS